MGTRTAIEKQAAPHKNTNSEVLRAAPAGWQEPILNLQRSIGNQGVQHLMRSQIEGKAKGNFSSRRAERSGVTLQPRLMVNTPGDAYEQEADRVAEQVTRMPQPQDAVSAATSSAALSGSARSASVQMTASEPGSAGGVEAPPIVHEVLGSPGQPLDAATRAFMEPRFGQDLSGVRVHTDDQAAESARAVNAKAYTVGSNVVFGAGEFTPGTQEGQRLLGHELAHVVQQSGSAGASPQVQRQPAGNKDDPRAKAKEQHEAQQRNVVQLLDEARGWKKDKDFEKFSQADKLYVNTIEMLDNNKMELVVLTPTHYWTAQDRVYFDDRVKHPNIGGDYPENPKHRVGTVVSPGPETGGTTNPQPTPQSGFVPTVPPKQERDPITGDTTAPPAKAKAQTPPVLDWIGAVVRLFLDTSPVSQGELRNVFVHEGQHVADLIYLKNARLDDWQSMLELYKSEFRAFWLQPPIPMGGGRFSDPDKLSNKDQETLTIDENRKCEACKPPAGSKSSARSQQTKMKNARQKDIFLNLVNHYPKNEFDCFYVCNDKFRDAVDAFDLPAGENSVNSVRLLDFRLELQKLTEDISSAEFQKTQFLATIKALNDMDWDFLKDANRSQPLWDLIKGFAPAPIYKALKALAGKKNPQKEASKALEDAVKKMK